MIKEPNRFFCTFRQMMILQILLYSWSLMTTACCCINYTNFNIVKVCKNSTKIMPVTTQLLSMLQWHCLLNEVVCSRAIDCCSTFQHKLLHTKRSVTSNTLTMGEQNIGHSVGLCLHTASCNQLSATVQVSVYTKPHVTNCRPQFRSLSTHSFT